MAKYATYTSLIEVEPLQQFEDYADLPPLKTRAGKVVAPSDVARLLRVCAQSVETPPPALRTVLPDLEPYSLDALVAALVDEWLARCAMGDHWVLLAALHLPNRTAATLLAPLLSDWRRRLGASAARTVISLVAKTDDPQLLMQLMLLADDLSLGPHAIDALARANPFVLAAVLAPAWHERSDRIEQIIDKIGARLLRLPWTFHLPWFDAAVRDMPKFASFAATLLWQLDIGIARVDEDGQLVDLDDELVLPVRRDVQLAQPWRLPEPTVRAWEERLADYEIIQPFPQLARQ